MFTNSKVKAFVARHLSESRAGIPIRNLYYSVFNRDYIRIQKARRGFYRQFVNVNSLVFDIGANHGEHADVFLRLGARVVAVEPNPVCCKRIRALRHDDRRLTVRCEAVGDRQGEADLFTGVHDGHSTVSEEWMQAASKTNAGFKWNEPIKVHLNTLDSIRREYGTPDFIKIDVEGYEANVLRGMSFLPSALGFEFHAFGLASVEECLSLPVFGSACAFNIAQGESWTLAWQDWRDKAAVLNYIATLPADVFGDIYARFEHRGAALG